MLLAADHQAHFVQVPFIARTGQPTPDLVGEGLAELARPLPHGLVAHVNAAGRQHLFDHAQAERKAEVEPHGVADDLAWKAVAGVGGLGGGCHAGHLPVLTFPAKPRPAPPQVDGAPWLDGAGEAVLSRRMNRTPSRPGSCACRAANIAAASPRPRFVSSTQIGP